MLSQEKLRRAFDMFDVDKTGEIGTEQIKNVIGVGKNIEESVWEEMLEETNSSEINFE